MKNIKVLFISYNSINDSVAKSQVIPYLEKLALKDIDVTLLSYEKVHLISDSDFINKMKQRLSLSKIRWYRLRYHKKPSLPATIYDIIQGIIYVFLLDLKYRFDVIHARMIVPATICLFLQKIRKFRWLFDMRGLLAEEYVGHGRWKENGIKFKLVKYIEKKCILNANFIIVLTQRQKDFILGLPFMNKKNIGIDVIPCCVDLEKFTLNLDKKNPIIEQFGLRDKFILIYLGSLGTCYLLLEMLDYFLCLRRRIHNAFFLFVVNDNKDYVLKKVEERGLKKEEFGVVSCNFEDVPAMLSVGDAGIYFINPYKKIGSCPIKLGEFLACGLPVISNSGIGDTAEIIKGNKIGVILDNFTPEDYQKSINELLVLFEERELLGNRCRAVALKYLSLDAGSEKYQNIYKKLTSEL